MDSWGFSSLSGCSLLDFSFWPCFHYKQLVDIIFGAYGWLWKHCLKWKCIENIFSCSVGCWELQRRTNACDWPVSANWMKPSNWNFTVTFVTALQKCDLWSGHRNGDKWNLEKAPLNTRSRPMARGEFKLWLDDYYISCKMGYDRATLMHSEMLWRYCWRKVVVMKHLKMAWLTSWEIKPAQLASL